MSPAFLILTHHQPAHFKQLIRALSSINGAVFVHVDKKTDERPFRQAARDAQNVSFIERRRRVFYTGYSMVRATLELMKAPLRDSPSVRNLILLSGGSYPIKPDQLMAEMLGDSTAILGHTQVHPQSECDRHVLALRYQDCSLLNERIAGQSRIRSFVARVAQELLERVVRKGDSPVPLFAALSGGRFREIWLNIAWKS